MLPRLMCFQRNKISPFLSNSLHVALLSPTTSLLRLHLPSNCLWRLMLPLHRVVSTAVASYHLAAHLWCV